MSRNRHKIKSSSSKELLTAFTPRAKLEPSHSLISNHMKAHYQRIASVQAKIDSHPPTSMLKSIKAKEHQTASTSKNASHNSDNPDNSRLHSTRGNFTHDHPDKWRQYVTKTGRLTGYLIKTRNCTSSSKNNERKEIWKPAFSLNTTDSLNTNYPSLNQSAVHEINSHGLNRTNTNGDDGKKCEEEEYYDSFSELSTSSTSIHSPAKQYVTDTEVKETKRKMHQRQEELEYLGFISGITQDILSRQCLSDAALELLIGCHIERNLHRLDKDKMMERVAELKEQLGFTV